MANVIVAIIGEDKDADEILFKGFKSFKPDIAVLFVKEKYEKKGKKISKELDKFNVETKITSVPNFLKLEDVFMFVKDTSQLYKDDHIVINVDTDYMSSCLALSSAFVNGIAAIGILGDQLISYPIMKFSYYNAINDKKMHILHTINKNKSIESMEKLSKITGMSLPLIAYHLKGNRDSKGLVEMSLVETERENGALRIHLTDLGRLIVNGCVDFDCPTCK